MRLFRPELIGPALLGVAAAIALPATAHAQSGERTTVVQAENVRLDYAHVLKVEPVYQTLRASRTEMQCEETEPAPQPPPASEVEEEGRWSRLVNSVRGVFGDDQPPAPAAPPPPSGPLRSDCRMVPVEREFRRPIAYDVDYVYKGMKYRSRLAEDPGNRLRIRVSVTPYVPGQAGNP